MINTHMLINEILDYNVTVRSNLNPKIWDRRGQMHDTIRDQLKKIAHAFEEFVGVELDVQDRTLTGSMANYTWTTHSDLDVHIVVAGQPTAEQRELYMAKKALWSEQHAITVKGIPVECYVQGQDEPHHSTGVYSIDDNKWVITPKRVKPRINDSAVTAKARDLAHAIKLAIHSRDLEKLHTVKDRVTNMRKSGLDRAGEWSTENIVFKILRNHKLIDHLTTAIRKLEDQDLSLEQAQ